MIVAAIQLSAELGNVQFNYSKASELVRQAIAKRAQLIVLPEFFTSAMALNPIMEEVARRNIELDIPQQFFELSIHHGCVIAGSYLNIISGDIYNSMILQFPSGERLVHNKDIPTQFENRYYTTGDRLRSKSHVGVALCWEMIRSQTLLEMPLSIRIVAAGSCWWDLPCQSNDASLRDYNHKLNRDTPPRMASFLGVPVIHASQVGIVTGFKNAVSDSIVDRQLIGRTQIINKAGQIQNELDITDGDAVLVDVVEIPEVGMRAEITRGFWTVKLPPQYLEAWDRENRNGQEYYQMNRARMVGNFTT
jgi:predicted amidohydrolase